MTVVLDIDRPDVDGVPPKMKAICDHVREALKELAENGTTPVLSISTDDNIMSSVYIAGSFDPREKWANGIFENSRYFKFFIRTEKDRRYYEEGLKVCISGGGCYKIKNKFRKSTSTPEKVTERLKNWIIESAELVKLSE